MAKRKVPAALKAHQFKPSGRKSKAMPAALKRKLGRKR